MAHQNKLALQKIYQLFHPCPFPDIFHRLSQKKKHQDFETAYRVACLGVTEALWGIGEGGGLDTDLKNMPDSGLEIILRSKPLPLESNIFSSNHQHLRPFAACIEADWRMLALDALQSLRFDIARKANQWEGTIQ